MARPVKLPRTIGASIDALYTARAERLALQKEQEAALAPLKERERELEAHILDTFDKAEIGASSGALATASVERVAHPTVDDWDAFYAHVQTTGEFDLLNRAVKAAAVRERWDAGDAVPGVGSFVKVGLSLTKVAKRKARQAPAPVAGKTRRKRAGE